MLAGREDTESNGVGSRTWPQRRRRLSGTPDTTALGTFSDPIDLRYAGSRRASTIICTFRISAFLKEDGKLRFGCNLYFLYS
jgi:hypothetical protein